VPEWISLATTTMDGVSEQRRSRVEQQKTGRAIFVQALYGKLDISPNFTLFVTTE